MIPNKQAKQMKRAGKHAPKERNSPPLIQPPDRLWEQFYPLANDPELHAAGIEVGARVTVKAGEPLQLRIVFRAGQKEGEVACVHIAVYAGPIESLPPDKDLAKSSEHYPVLLAPEEHFFALNSYVAGIAEVGLGTMFTAAEEAADLPVGFNAVMQEQVLRALLRVAPITGLNFLLWVRDDKHKTEQLIRPDPNPLIPMLALREELIHNTRLPPELLAYLAEDNDWSVRGAIALNPSTPAQILARLAEDKNWSVQQMVASNLHTPTVTLAHLAENDNPDVRGAVAININTPAAILAHLAEDDNPNVRKSVAHNPRPPLKIIVYLAKDENSDVREAAIKNPCWDRSTALANLDRVKRKFKGLF